MLLKFKLNYAKKFPYVKYFTTNIPSKANSFNIWKINPENTPELEKILNYFKSYHTLHRKEVNIIESPDEEIDFSFENDVLSKLANKDLISCTQSEFLLRLSKSLRDHEEGLNEIKNFPSSVKEYLLKLLGKKVESKIIFPLVDETSPKHRSSSLSLKMSNPELIFGVTFLAIDPNTKEYEELIVERFQFPKEEQVNKRIYAINPINKSKIPLIVSRKFKGVKACVPAHDEVAFGIAQRLKIPITYVLKPIKEIDKEEENSIQEPQGLKNKEDIKLELMLSQSLNKPKILSEQNENQFLLTNSKEFDFLFPIEARELVINHLLKSKSAERSVSYGINDLHVASKNLNKDKSFTREFSMALDPIRSKKFLPISLCIVNDLKDVYLILITRILYQIAYEDKLKESKQKNDDLPFFEEELPLASELIKKVYLYDPKDFSHIEGIGTELEKLNEEITKILTENKISFDPTVILDEAFDLNLKGTMLKLLMDYSEVFRFTDAAILVKSFGKYKATLDKFKELIRTDSTKRNFNCVLFLYINYLLMFSPFNKELTNKLYREILSVPGLNTKETLKQSLEEYDLSKLKGFVYSVVEMLNKSMKVNLFLNKQDKGKITVDINLRDKDKYDVIDYLKESHPEIMKDINWEDYTEIEYSLDYRTMSFNFIK